ncbi:hypothetical protein D3C80_1672990 [compost metagenome]
MRIVWIVHTALQNIQSFQDQNIRLFDNFIAFRHDVIDKVRVYRRSNTFGTGFNFRNEFHQAMHIVGLRESFFLHQAALVQNLVRVQKAVCGDQLHATMFRPAAQQRLQ